MNYQVVVSHEAEKVLDRLDCPTEHRIRQRILLLASDPVDPRLSSPLTDRDGLRKSRVGGWRILFTVDRTTKTVYVLAIDTRGQVYRH